MKKINRQECKCNKVKYDSKKSALTQINQLKHMTRKSDVTPVRAYCCPCDGVSWHISSDRKDKGNKVGTLLHPEAFIELLKQNQDE